MIVNYMITLGTIAVLCHGCLTLRKLFRKGYVKKGALDDCDCDCDCCKHDYPAAVAYTCPVPVPPNAGIRRLPIELELNSVVFISEPIEPIDNVFRGK
jgi:hypothetical protein